MALNRLFKQLEQLYAAHAYKYIQTLFLKCVDDIYINHYIQNDLINQAIIVWC